MGVDKHIPDDPKELHRLLKSSARIPEAEEMIIKKSTSKNLINSAAVSSEFVFVEGQEEEAEAGGAFCRSSNSVELETRNPDLQI